MGKRTVRETFVLYPHVATGHQRPNSEVPTAGKSRPSHVSRRRPATPTASGGREEEQTRHQQLRKVKWTKVTKDNRNPTVPQNVLESRSSLTRLKSPSALEEKQKEKNNFCPDEDRGLGVRKKKSFFVFVLCFLAVGSDQFVWAVVEFLEMKETAQWSCPSWKPWRQFPIYLCLRPYF